jgi:AcrR family transcriptional regulator
MDLFQAHGYEGASMSDLTAAMGISAPSLYNAFGSKEGLFRETVAYYVAHDGGAPARALREQPTARGAIETMMLSTLANAADGTPDSGCLVVLGAANCADGHRNVDDFLKGYRRGNFEAIHQRLRKAQAEKELPANVDTEGLAGFYSTVMNGLAIQIRDGVPRDRLERVVRAAMVAWPVG